MNEMSEQQGPKNWYIYIIVLQLVSCYTSTLYNIIHFLYLKNPLIEDNSYNFHFKSDVNESPLMLSNACLIAFIF